ncbi:MAG TPA: POTRA domain-containing protein, partial [Terriglobales bacterium]|nr:POTRA domain-containing protein [Terriglobales bacterium]
MRIFRNSALVALVSVTLLLQAQQLPAPNQPPAKTDPQTKEVLPSYEGQNVSSIEIAGEPNFDEQAILPSLPQKAGQPFSQAKINESANVLMATGRFKAVQVKIVPDVNGVRVLLVVQPGMYFGMYFFPGAVGPFAYSQLLQIANYPPEGPYTNEDVKTASNLLLRFYQRNGYFHAQIKPELRQDRQHGIVSVVYRTTLGKKAKFGNVTIQGATPEDAAQLKGKVTSLMARLKGSAIRPGKTYSLKTVQNATRYLENSLMKQGHLAATVKLIGATYDPATNRADIGFQVKTGPIMNVKVEGAHLWSWTKHKLLPIYQQVGVDQEIVQEGQRDLVSYFQSKGYFDAKVNVNVTPTAKGQDIIYQIQKGPRHKVDDVSIAGNTTLPNDDLISHVAVKKGHFLSHGSYSEQLVRQSVKNLEAVYKAAGFSTVKVQPEVKNASGNIDVTFRVVEGPRDIVESLQVVGNDTMPVSELLPGGLQVRPGQPYSQKLVDQDRTNITARYLQLGYLTSTFIETVKQAGKDPHRLAVTYKIYEGPRVIASNIVTVGGKDTKRSFIDKTVQLQAKAPLTTTEMLSAESRLYEPGIFDWAEVDPRRQITTQNQEDVVVKVHEAQRNSITYGFGFEIIKRGGSIPGGTVTVPGIPPIGVSQNFKTSEKTFYGPRGTFEYTRKNIRGKAETLTLGGLAGRLDQRGNITFQDPHFRGTNWASDVSLLGEHDSTNPIFTSRIGQVSAQLQHILNADKTQHVFLRYNFSETGITRLLPGFQDLVPPEDRHVRLSTLAASYIRDTRDNTLDAHKGIYESLEFDFNPSALGSSVDFSRLLGQVAYFKQLSPDKIIWANSLRLGFIQPFNGSHIPLEEAFFSGGGSTLRGFPLNGAGPQRTITICGNPADQSTCAVTTVPVGGNELLIVNSEFRIPVPLKNGLGVVAFYDGG